MSNLDRWHNPAQLQRDHDDAICLIDRQGMIRCTDEYWIAEAKGVFLKIIVALWDVVMSSTLSLVYCYDQSAQPPHLAKCEGYSSVSTHLPSGRQVSSIGISIKALQGGDSHAALILLHELTHILSSFPSEHGAAFHERLDKLIEQYNMSTEASVKNDYQ